MTDGPTNKHLDVTDYNIHVSLHSSLSICECNNVLAISLNFALYEETGTFNILAHTQSNEKVVLERGTWATQSATVL